MASGEVVIQSMWSPAVAAVRSKGIPCNYQPLKEGYRAWGGGLGLAAHLDGRQARRGLRVHQLVHCPAGSAAISTARATTRPRWTPPRSFMSEDEWGFWIEGKPAKGDILVARRQGHGEGRRGARRRLLRRAHGQGRLLELGDGRGPLHGDALERVHRGVSAAPSRLERVGGAAAASGSAPSEGRDDQSAASRSHAPRPATTSPRQHAAKRATAAASAALAPYLQAAPLALILGAFLLLPILMIVVVSFWDYDFAGMYPDFVTHQLCRHARLLGDLEDLSQHAEVRGHRLGADARSSASGSPISSPSTSAPRPCRWCCSSSAPCRS